MAKPKTNTSWQGVATAAEVADISAADHTFVNVIRALYVGADGDLVLRLVGDDADCTFKGLKAGTVLPVAPSIIRRTGTSAAIQAAGMVLGLI